MMGISAADVKELRERTSAGMMDCKEALEETDGDMEEAIEYLRKEGLSSAEKKAGRTASEGLVTIKEDDSLAVIVEVNSETDFAAKNDKFVELVENIADHILENQPATVEEAEEQTLEAGKTVQETIKETIAQIGENISLRRFEIVEKEAAEAFGTYIHMGGNIGTIVAVDNGDQELAQNIAMHIAATNPDYLSRESVPEEDIEKEKELLREQALKEEDKPEHIIDKIVEGRLDKFYNQNCLVEQEYVKDTDKTVGELLAEKEAEVKRFIRYEVGEGIEVEEEDFAEEVMNEMDK